MTWILVSFFSCIALAFAGTWFLTRNESFKSCLNYFLAGRKLTYPFIAGSLLLTDLDAEELVGLNGSAFSDGLCIMVWEVGAVVSILFAANFFLPRLLRASSTSIPDFLEQRFHPSTGMMVNIVFILAYIFSQIPIVLYSGAQMLRTMFGFDVILQRYGICGEYFQLLVLVAALAGIGAVYALWGGLKTCVVSDTLTGFGWLVGGFLVLYFGLNALGGEEGFINGVKVFFREGNELKKLNSLGSADSSVPFFTIFTGALVLSSFYWCSNQFILQRSLGSKSLAEGQKGTLLCGVLKLFSPFYLVFPGIIACIMVSRHALQISGADEVYGIFARAVVPRPLIGCLAAILFGGVISTFDSLLNSVCTLCSLNIYRRYRPSASDRSVIRVGFWCGIVLTLLSIFLSPLCFMAGRIFDYMISCLSVYGVAIFYVVVLGVFCRKASVRIANTGFVLTFLVMLFKLFYKDFPGGWLGHIHELHFTALVFAASVLLGFIFSHFFPAKQESAQTRTIFAVNCTGHGDRTQNTAPPDAGIDLTPWKYTGLASLILLAAVVAFYLLFADFSVF